MTKHDGSFGASASVGVRLSLHTLPLLLFGFFQQCRFYFCATLQTAEYHNSVWLHYFKNPLAFLWQHTSRRRTYCLEFSRKCCKYSSQSEWKICVNVTTQFFVVCSVSYPPLPNVFQNRTGRRSMGQKSVKFMPLWVPAGTLAILFVGPCRIPASWKFHCCCLA